MSTFYFIIFILFIVYITWTWNSTKELETTITRISYILIGTIFVTLVTIVIFSISRIGIEYPLEEMIGQVRKITTLIFVPINGFVILNQFANIVSRIKKGDLSKDEFQKKMKIILIILVILFIFEIIYFKHIQNGIIKVIKANG